MSVTPAASTPGIARTLSTIRCRAAARCSPFEPAVVVDGNHGSLRGAETEVDVEYAQQAPEQQSGADEQHARQRHFGDHQARAQALVLPAGLSIRGCCRSATAARCQTPA